MKICDTCGSTNLDSDKFCASCGAKLPDDASSIDEATAKVIDEKETSNIISASPDTSMASNVRPESSSEQTPPPVYQNVNNTYVQVTPPPSNTTALIGLISSLVSLILCAGTLGLVSLIISIVGAVNVKKTGTGKGFAIAGIIISAVQIVFWVFFIAIFGLASIAGMADYVDKADKAKVKTKIKINGQEIETKDYTDRNDAYYGLGNWEIV